MLFCLEKRQEHQEAGHTGHLDVSDPALLWSVLSEEERKLWMERAVDFEYSSCSADLGMQLALAGAVLLPQRDATAASVPFPSLASCHKAVDTVGGMRKMLRCYHALCQQEMPDVPDDKFPLEPSARERSRTPRDVPADMLPLPEEFKDLDKIGSSFINLAPPPVAPVDKVVWEPMEALTQLDWATDDSVMEEDSVE